MRFKENRGSILDGMEIEIITNATGRKEVYVTDPGDVQILERQHGCYVYTLPDGRRGVPFEYFPHNYEEVDM